MFLGGQTPHIKGRAQRPLNSLDPLLAFIRFDLEAAANKFGLVKQMENWCVSGGHPPIIS